MPQWPPAVLFFPAPEEAASPKNLLLRGGRAPLDQPAQQRLPYPYRIYEEVQQRVGEIMGLDQGQVEALMADLWQEYLGELNVERCVAAAREFGIHAILFQETAQAIAAIQACLQAHAS